MEHLAVFVPSHPHPLLSTVYQCEVVCPLRVWVLKGCLVLPAIGAVSVLELAANIVEAPGCLRHPTSA